MVELARELKSAVLPTSDPTELAQWFHRGAQRGNLTEYLEGFSHTIAVMQTREGLERVAFESLEDMSLDGVIHAEVRFAPVFHTSRGLTQDEVVRAVIAGLENAARQFGATWGLIICAMRDRTDSLDAAKPAIRWRDQGVVGFDLAGGEDGFPPKQHLDAFQAIQRSNFNIIIHAGEADGMDSIWQALQYCGAHRLGHGTRPLDDITINSDGSLKLGTLARFVLDHRIPLEMCLSSDVHTGTCKDFKSHPYPLFLKAGFRVFLNTDDRLMSDTEMSKELAIATEVFDLTLHDLEKMTLNAAKISFAHHRDRVQLIDQIIIPLFRELSR